MWMLPSSDVGDGPEWFPDGKVSAARPNALQLYGGDQREKRVNMGLCDYHRLESLEGHVGFGRSSTGCDPEIVAQIANPMQEDPKLSLIHI